MPELYLTKIQPNPLGKDVARYGTASHAQLNNEWPEFEVVAPSRNLAQDVLAHTRTALGNAL